MTRPVEFLPGDDPEGRLFSIDIVGYLLGYADHLRVSLEDNLRHHTLVLMAQ
jgi:hypothetical protein